MTHAAPVRWQRLRVPLAIGAGLSGALWLLGFGSVGTLQRWLGPQTGLSVALSRARFAAGEREMCVLIGDSRMEALGEWRSDCRVLNLGRPGARAAGWHRDLHALRAGLPLHSRVAVWMGVNDLMHAHAAPDGVANDLIVVIAALSFDGHPVVVLPQLAVHTRGPRRQVVSADSAQVDALVRAAFAYTSGVSFVQPGELGVAAAGPDPSFYRDGLHLSDAANARTRTALDRAFARGAAAP